jgi:hypothetical protein
MRSHLVFLFLCALVAPAALAGPPHPGTYRSTDLGGAVLTGNFSESWMPAGTHGQVGNTVNTLSWDGAALGSQWKFYCPSIVTPPSVFSDSREGTGTGAITYQTSYGGGVFWMSGAGPWGDNTNDYTGTLQNFTVRTVYRFIDDQLVSIQSSVSTLGSFDGSSHCLEYTINSATFTGTTEYGPKPVSYPDFLAATCVANGVDRGGWGSAQEISLVILHCQVAVEPAAWSTVKRLYD